MADHHITVPSWILRFTTYTTYLMLYFTRLYYIILYYTLRRTGMESFLIKSISLSVVESLLSQLVCRMHLEKQVFQQPQYVFL